MKSTLEHTLPILRILQRLGIFPFKFVYSNKSKGKSKEFLRLELENSITFQLRQVCFYLYILFRLGFCVRQLSKSYLENKAHIHNYISAGCFSLLHISGLIITSNFNWKKNGVILLLNSWKTAELEIQNKYGNRIEGDLKLNSEPYLLIRNYLYFLVFEGVGISIMSNVFHPKHFALLYSLVESDEEVLWLRLISFLEATFISCLLWIEYLQWDFLTMSFPRSVRNSLRRLLPTEAVGNHECYSHVPVDPASSWHTYITLNRLVLHMNSLFGNLFLVLKFIFIVCFCMLVYLPIRGGREVEFIVIGTFFALKLVLVQKVSMTLMATGQVHQAAVEFKQTWRNFLSKDVSRGFHDSRTVSTKLFEYGPTIAFRVASLYDIQTSTLLTFFSVTTTYVIVALQI